MSRIEFANDGVEVDGGILAQAFAISREDLRRRMRDGAITSRLRRVSPPRRTGSKRTSWRCCSFDLSSPG